MLNKKEIYNFTEQFFLGKIKLKKNPTVYGKNDSYNFVKDGLFISFHNDEILLRIPDMNSFIVNTENLTPKIKNYIHAVNTIIKIENKVRDNNLARKLDGDVYTELRFKINNKKIILDLFTLKSYFAIKEKKTNFGFMFIDFPYYCNYSAKLSVEIPYYHSPSHNLSVHTSSNKKITGDFEMFTSSIVNEIIDFNYFLDNIFNDQLNTLEMALL